MATELKNALWKSGVGLLATVLVLSLTSSLPAYSRSGPSFSEASLFGSYILRFATFNYVELGVYSFDGRGNVSGSEEVDSHVCEVTGSYTVNADGTGSMSVTLCAAADIAGWNFVIADPLALTVYAFTSEVGPLPTPGVSATFTRQVALRPFTLASLSGSYAFRISGPVTQAGPLAGVGTLNADGKGDASVTLSLQALDGTCSGATSGTYTVNANGTGTLSLPSIWLPPTPNCTYFGSAYLTLTPWNLFFHDAAGSQIDAIVDDGNEYVLGSLSCQ
jgi:hypothetical protein